jgi:hypothetical protein
VYLSETSGLALSLHCVQLCSVGLVQLIRRHFIVLVLSMFIGVACLYLIRYRNQWTCG